MGLKVPQGSLVEHRLYFIYVIEIPGSTIEGELHPYVNDTSASVIGHNLHDVIIKLRRLFD